MKQACLRALYERAPEVSAIWEAFGGIGVQAEVLRERWPQAFICATELDEECVEEYNRNGWGECTLSDCLTWLRLSVMGSKQRWGISLDYNRFTILDLWGRRSGWQFKVELLQEVVARRPAWIQLTDTAVHYLRLNWQTYKLPSQELSDYVIALSTELERRFGYKVTAYRNRHTSTYLLLEPL